MPATSQFAFDSRLPTDKIVKTISGNFNASTSARQADEFGTDVYSKLEVSHGFTRPVFTKLKWSLDGINWVDGGSAQLQSNPLIQCITYSTATNVVILSTSLSGLIYYEIICFWIEDYDLTDPLVESFTDPVKPYAFDSRLNYQKIFMQGRLSFTGAQSVTHNLGYLPNTWVYFESNNGQVWPAIFGGAGNAWFYMYTTQREIEYSITQTELSMIITGSATRVWYRIYEEGS